MVGRPAATLPIVLLLQLGHCRNPIERNRIAREASSASSACHVPLSPLLRCNLIPSSLSFYPGHPLCPLHRSPLSSSLSLSLQHCNRTARLYAPLYLHRCNRPRVWRCELIGRGVVCKARGGVANAGRRCAVPATRRGSVGDMLLQRLEESAVQTAVTLL